MAVNDSWYHNRPKLGFKENGNYLLSFIQYGWDVPLEYKVSCAIEFFETLSIIITLIQ